MKRGLFLLATMTLTSALYAQSSLTSEQVRQIIGNFNPQLLEKAAQDKQVSQLVDQLVDSYLAKQPANSLASRYELAALARNFDNSVALHYVTQQYQQAVRYSQAGGNTEDAVRAHAQQQLREIYARIWAVSVQNKEALLAQYKLLKDPQYQTEISILEADLKGLKTHVGEQITNLADEALEQAKAQVLAQQTTLQEAANLQVKTKHKKPVAE